MKHEAALPLNLEFGLQPPHSNLTKAFFLTFVSVTWYVPHNNSQKPAVAVAKSSLLKTRKVPC